MKIRDLSAFPAHFLLLLVLPLLLAAAPTVLGAFSYQSTPVGNDSRRSNAKTASKVQDGALKFTTYYDIPEASEPCAPDACHWWNEIRTTGNTLNRKDDKKLKAKFLLILHEGQEKAYRVPLKDRPPQALAAFGRPRYPQAVQGKVTGSAAVSIEYRADGSVGEVKIVKGLGFGIDESLITAARKMVFLPAVENGAFITRLGTATTEFHRVSPPSYGR